MERLKRVGKRTIIFENEPKIVLTSSVVGPKEGKGPLGQYFHNVLEDDKAKEKTFEKAERQILSIALNDVATKLKEKGEQLDCIVGGDLLNQITTTSFTAREMHLPLLGLYSACSTMSESLLVGSMLIDGGYAKTVACSSVSHFSSAERQYRFPLEQGTQRPPIAQWTVTGSGVCVLSNSKEDLPKITRGQIGEVVDFGVVDVNNMGAAMAPAAMTTLVNFFEDTNSIPNDYDLILTGDLGVLGSEILCDLMKDRGFEFCDNHKDCGALIYNKNPKRFQGGSGAGCSASVFSAYIYPMLNKKEIKKMLFLATGALLSTTSSQQGDSIPGISHLVEIKI
ncbi:MAG: stage V sporulation protein AD [Clostridia bacterium]|nr:stage V sporulation protein AD [Clostridia bacterium]